MDIKTNSSFLRSRRWTHTVANVTSNLWWFIVTKTFKDISTQLGMCVPFFLYGAVCVFGFIFIYIFLPETRGRTPEETARAFRGLGPIVRRTGCLGFCLVVCRCCFTSSSGSSTDSDGDEDDLEDEDLEAGYGRTEGSRGRKRSKKRNKKCLNNKNSSGGRSSSKKKLKKIKINNTSGGGSSKRKRSSRSKNNHSSNVEAAIPLVTRPGSGHNTQPRYSDAQQQATTTFILE